MKTFTVIWSFEINPGCENEFEKLYGSEGDWVKLFKTDTNYIKTELQKDIDNPVRYITIDYWKSKEAYYNFKEMEKANFIKIDRLGEKLTIAESYIGKFYC